MQLNRTLQPALSALSVSTRSWQTVALMVSADAIALSLAGISSVYIRLYFDGQYHPSLYWQLWPVLGLFLLAFAAIGLYPGVTITPVEELRRTSLATTLMYLALAATIFLRREGEVYSRGVFLMAWGLTLIFVLLGRVCVRRAFARRSWWGYPVMVLGGGKTGELVIRTLKRRPGIGLKPVLVLDDDPAKHGSIHGVPVVGGIELAPGLAKSRQIHYAIVAMPGVPRGKLLNLLERYGQTFPHLLIIPDLFGLSSLWVTARDLGGVLGLEIRQQLLLPGSRLVKFLIDRTTTAIGGILILPVIVLIAIAIKLDSRGPIFYRQIRIGRDGRHFKAWKFRSMVWDADQALKAHFELDPELAIAWQQDHKLKRDPRITRVGRFLRHTSLDELPQLWNILRGEMSLVGPRPIVDEEVPRYGEKFSLYTKVTPGLTGLWQVSGRNNVSYQERVNLDAYYVRNWSVWLDLYILLRTIWVVVSGEGAY
ncbi:undecaprenyl-phosphate galactose phosphotransferase WbaP [Microcoleus sp. FACHB-1515]|uniref:undecaprenyl-phosphate galactose phosphotransferase WbaP n=1 Tax=Cyanophyceae TaxID=3028117 RepID=UPI001684F647|nr:undecaprenyl-phosphate galactose phosphotransferase WbaP [Microcoleus sp. FACHB-1515]MBD2088480.1 undecaprenyl-phosphate galactose phosphotransferase WbaP [Microcoleus sp. FACHB-1515]